MKFQFVIQDGTKAIRLIAENKGEEQLLASCEDDAKHGAVISFEKSEDRSPYQRTKVMIVTM